MDATRSETAPSPTADREIIIERIINAPRERVWHAFTDPKAVEQWWGPDGFTLTTKAFDFSVGGDWIFTMHGPDGRDYLNHIRFTEIVKPSLMAHDHGGDLAGDERKVMFKATITLDDLGAKTRVTMRSVFPTAEARALVVKEYGAIEGGKQHLARLDQFVSDFVLSLPTEDSLEITRTFNAPPALVYRAWTEPEMMRQWFGGPPPFITPVCEVDVRSGGAWRMVMRDPEGVDYPLKGAFEEVVPGERLVMNGTLAEHPASFHGIVRNQFPAGHPEPSPEFSWTVTFADVPGGTRLTMRMRLPDRIHRDAHIKLGTELGWGASMQRLAELLTTIS
ncbi:MAG: SRPBCC domain-containing protein [Flavobacteriales bacterium]